MIAELEARAFAAWPAAEVEALGGWRLRATAGVTRRANSAWTAGDAGELGAAIARTEAFYSARGLPAAFQLCPLSPPALDGELAARGYRAEGAVSIQTAELAGLASPTPPGVAARVHASLSHGWFELAAHRGRYASTPEVFRGLVDRIGGRAGFALAEVDSVPAATALGVCEAGWLGVFAMATLSGARRRGAATALLDALRAWGESLGAARAYLQVERDNAPAQALYARHGFREAYGYHYRVSAAARASTRSA